MTINEFLAAFRKKLREHSNTHELRILSTCEYYKIIRIVRKGEPLPNNPYWQSACPLTFMAFGPDANALSPSQSADKLGLEPGAWVKIYKTADFKKDDTVFDRRLRHRLVDARRDPSHRKPKVKQTDKAIDVVA